MAGRASLWQRYSTGRSKQAVRLSVLLACTLVVIIQLTECFSKLVSPPVSTHSRIVLNDSLTYPAITLCRSPPYKFKVLEKYNLGTEIRWTSEWDNFPYENVTLTQFWDEATYSLKDTIPVYAIQNKPDLVAIENNTFFLSGRCQTLKPLIQTRAAGSVVGYSLILNYGHSQKCLSCIQKPGWNIYIHEEPESWTENGMQTSGRMENLFLEVGEELQVKVGIQEFHRLNQPDNPCNVSRSYSVSKCEALCHWNALAQNVGCSAPWMNGINMTHCDTAETHKQLIVDYLVSECKPPCCNCIQPCHTAQYTASIVNRKLFQTTIANHNLSQLYVFFATKMVAVVEEHYAYDWSLFVSDLGGSLGFLLGLSVLGVIGLIERIVEAIVGCFGKAEQEERTQVIQHLNLNKNTYEVDGITYKY